MAPFCAIASCATIRLPWAGPTACQWRWSPSLRCLFAGLMFALISLGFGFFSEDIAAGNGQVMGYGTCCQTAPIVVYNGLGVLSYGLFASTAVEARQTPSARRCPRPATQGAAGVCGGGLRPA